MKNVVKILYRNDLDWRLEEQAAKQRFECIDSRLLVRQNDLVLARFSALPFYRELEKDVLSLKARLINSYRQHRYIADLGNWYHDLADMTPRTWKELHEIPEEGKQFVLKGETNSKKYYWNTMMFAADKQQAIKVHSLLTSDNLLQYQHIYIREYVPLEVLSTGLQGLPITKEYRFFVYKDRVISGGFYWSAHVDQLKHVPDPNEVPKNFLNKAIERIRNTEISEPPDYYVIDVAKTQSGDWIIIELNDAQMSGLSENDPNVLYENLKKELINETMC
jgi:hypothetical protein